MKIYKISLLLLLIFIACNSCNKKSHSYRTDNDSEFKYEYIFSFEETDTSRVKIEKKDAIKSKIKGIVSDDYGHNFCSFQLSGRYIKRIIEVDEHGKFEVEIPKGTYKIQTRGCSDYISFDFTLEENTEVNFDFYLKYRQRLPTIYQINSKTPLSKRKIEKIKKCVKENRNKEKGEPCWEKGKYYIFIQI